MLPAEVQPLTRFHSFPAYIPNTFSAKIAASRKMKDTHDQACSNTVVRWRTCFHSI